MRRISAASAVVLLTAASLVGGCGKPKSADEYIREAQARRAAGDLSAALIDLKNALQKEPDNVTARILLGRFYLDAPDAASAEAEFLRAQQDGAPPAEIAQPLAEAELLLGKPAAALRQTEQLEGLSGGRKAGLMAERAQALMALGQMADAKRTLDAALAEDADSTDVLAAMVRYALAEHDLSTARERLTRAQEIDPNSVTLTSLEGIVTFAAGDLAASEGAFRRMSVAARWNLSAYLGMARAEVAQGKLDEADGNLAVVLKAAPADPNANYLSALIAYQRRDYAQAQLAALRTLQVSKGFAPALLVAGASSLALKQYEQANVYLGQYVYLVPQNLQARKLLASVQLQLSFPADAVKTLASAAQASDDAQLLALIGVAAARSGDLTAADRYLGMALARQPEDASLRAQFGMAELALGRTEVGIEELERAAKADPSGLRPDVVLFATYLREGQFDKAIEVAQRIKKAHASVATGYDFAGLAYLAKGDNERAEAELQRAREARPGDALALRLLAALSFRDAKLGNARQYLQELLNANPNDTPAEIGLAEIEIHDGHHEQAESILRRALQFSPDDAAVRSALGHLLLASGRHSEALRVVEPALSQTPQYPDLQDVVGQAQLAMGNSAGAISAFKAFVSAQPGSSAAHRYLAQAYAAAGEAELSLAEASKAVELDPKDPAAQMQMARAYLAKRDFARARMITGELASSRPDSPALAELEGQIAIAEGRPEQAVAAFQRGLTLVDDGGSRVRLARALVLAGRLDDAEEALRAWIAPHPDDVGARLSLGDLYLTAHRLDDAAAQYAAVAEKQPDNVAAQNNLAWVLSIKGNRAEALEHARHAADLAPHTPEVLDTLGVVLMRSERPADAVGMLRGAASAAPANPEIQFHFAQALVGAGSKEEAREVLRRLLASEQRFDEREPARRLLEELGG